MALRKKQEVAVSLSILVSPLFAEWAEHPINL